MKTVVIIAAAMVAAGVILAVVGVAFGGLNSVHFGPRGFYIGYDDLPDGRADFFRAFDAFDGIDVEADAYFITLREGDAYGVKVRNAWTNAGEPEIGVEDGVLRINADYGARRDRDARRGARIVNWLIKNFGGLGGPGEAPLIEITYPEDARLGGVVIDADAGNVTVSGLAAAALSVECDAGGLSIKETDARELRVDMNAGECRIDDTRAETAVVSMDAGSFSASGFDCGALTGNFNVGSVYVEGRLRGDVDISASMGDVRLKTDLPESDYDVDLDVSLGVASVNGREIGKADARGFGGPGPAPYKLRVKTDMGGVDVEFD
jgi:hypothetical protein